ncbi:YpmS family protein [uncultured Limosilactobacillus sp.]|uniref:YpmS family protein n=1 Tax=uncultured Limosilactobacillus sp. TaxID=2837629 RepID=UPI0025E181C2|nr:YpmS family protein [uncultured Limosilactobacillus sp.]
MKHMKTHNYWKWAFWGLIILLIGTGCLIYNRITAPVETPTEASVPAKTANSFEVTLNRKQVNALSSNYLDRLLKGNNIKYRFIVGTQYATIVGTSKFFGAKVQFAINFIPERKSNGNILLRAKGLSVGRLNLPIKYVMGYIKKQYKLPNWVYVNQQKQTILLDLNKYSQQHALHYSAEQIDVKNGQFRFLISIPKNGGF